MRSVCANPFEPYRFHTEAFVNISRDMIIKTLKDEGFGSFSPAMKPALTDTHKQRWQILGFDYWPAQSSDLNPIENVWAILEFKLRSRRCQAVIEATKC